MPAVDVRPVPPDQANPSAEAAPEEGWYDPDSVTFAAVPEPSDQPPALRRRVIRVHEKDVVLPDER